MLSRSWHKLGVLCLLLAGLACAGCQSPPTLDHPSPPAEMAAATERGAALWRLYGCRSCHGALAEGATAPALRGAVRAAPAFVGIVRSGAQGMRAYSHEEIPDQQLADLHAWLQALPAAAPTPIPNALGLAVPPGVMVAIFSDREQRPAGLAVGPDGAVYAAEQAAAGAGQIVRLPDADGDGRAEPAQVVAAGLDEPRGLAWWTPQGQAPILLAATSAGLVAADGDQARLAGLVGDASGRINAVGPGTDGLIYVTEGASGAGAPQPGAVWRFSPAALLAEDGPHPGELFASGLRSAAGIAISPSGAIYVTDNGRGWPLRPDVPDELNVLLGGGDYGWPTVWGQPPAGSGSIGPMALFPAGSDAGSLLFYSGRMFDEYAADLLVALPGLGQIVRVEIVSDVTGYQVTVHDFIGGLLRPVALAEGPQGELYVADAAAGRVYRLWR